MKLVAVVVVAGSSLAFAQPMKDPWAPDPVKVVSPSLKGPAPEIARPITVPAIPTFTIVAASNGHRTVQELRVAGRSLLGRMITVEGTITWIYDCVKALQKKGESRAQVQKRIEADQTLCERPKFYLGDSASTDPERSLWVVDVPRPMYKLERERLSKEEIDDWPVPPKLAVGDRVMVTGTFALVSAHREANSDGLLMFGAIAPAPASTTPKGPLAPPDPPKVPAFSRKKVERLPRDTAAGRASVVATNAGVRAYGQRKYDEAVAKYKEAIASWGGNHVAYYGLAGAYMSKNDWVAARDALDNAVSLLPDEAMYLMTFGYTMYESIIAAAKADEARLLNADPASVTVDLAKLDFSTALAPLRRAVELEPKLWRAHYYIGRIYRDQGFAKAAATELREAIALGATLPAPYIALVELYRKWDFPKEAIEIALLGTARVSADAADVWYVLGMAYDDQREYKLAIAAFTQSLAAKPDHAKALYQRGQAYYHTKDKKRARADLEAFVKSADAVTLSLAVQQAKKMLMNLGR